MTGSRPQDALLRPIEENDWLGTSRNLYRLMEHQDCAGEGVPRGKSNTEDNDFRGVS